MTSRDDTEITHPSAEVMRVSGGLIGRVLIDLGLTSQAEERKDGTIV